MPLFKKMMEMLSGEDTSKFPAFDLPVVCGWMYVKRRCRVTQLAYYNDCLITAAPVFTLGERQIVPPYPLFSSQTLGAARLELPFAALVQIVEEKSLQPFAVSSGEVSFDERNSYCKWHLLQSPIPLDILLDGGLKGIVEERWYTSPDSHPRFQERLVLTDDQSGSLSIEGEGTNFEYDLESLQVTPHQIFPDDKRWMGYQDQDGLQVRCEYSMAWCNFTAYIRSLLTHGAGSRESTLVGVLTCLAAGCREQDYKQCPQVLDLLNAHNIPLLQGGVRALTGSEFVPLLKIAPDVAKTPCRPMIVYENLPRPFQRENTLNPNPKRLIISHQK